MARRLLLSRSEMHQRPFESDFPPAVSCVFCGQPHCDGCNEPQAPLEFTLAWEQETEGSLERFWSTARQSASPAWLPALPQANLRQSMAFACFAELSTASSIALSILLLSAATFPIVTARAMTSGQVWLAGAALTGGFGLVMVLLHIVWGLCLELAVRSKTRTRALRQSLAFSLYACGWDVLTSPLGALIALARSGRSAIRPTLKLGAAAPRPLLFGYLRNRGVSPAAMKRVALASFSGPVLLLMIVVGYLLLHVLLRGHL